MSDILDLLSTVFSGKQAQQPVGPAYAPTPAPGIPAPQPNPMRTQPAPQPQSGPSWGDRLGDAFAGMGNADPNAGALQAFSQGFSGSRASRKSREDEDAQKAAASAEKKRLERQQAFDNELKRNDERRKDISSRLSNLETASNIKKLEQEAASYGVSADDYAKLETRLNDYREVLAGKYGDLFVDRENEDGSERGNSELFAIIDQMVEAERARQIDLMRQFGGGAAPRGQPDGTEQRPFEPKTDQEFAAIPQGAIYFNAADGQLYEKR